MGDSTLFEVSFFSGVSTRLKFIEEKVLEALYRCGLYAGDVRLDIYKLEKNNYGVRVHVRHRDASLWDYGRDIEQYAMRRILQQSKLKLAFVVFNCEEDLVFGQRTMLTSSLDIERALVRLRSNFQVLQRAPFALDQGVDSNASAQLDEPRDGGYGIEVHEHDQALHFDALFGASEDAQSKSVSAKVIIPTPLKVSRALSAESER